MKHPNHIQWFWFNFNPSSKLIPILEENLHRIYWNVLSENPNAIHLLKANMDKIDWFKFSMNPASEALQIIKNNQDRVYWHMLCQNTNPQAIQLLLENPDKIDWNILSKNPSAIHILEANQEQINWNNLSLNDAIFCIDYQATKRIKEVLHEELIAYAYHPLRVYKWIQKYGMDREYLEQ
jgi:hypothetical protein